LFSTQCSAADAERGATGRGVKPKPPPRGLMWRRCIQAKRGGTEKVQVLFQTAKSRYYTTITNPLRGCW